MKKLFLGENKTLIMRGIVTLLVLSLITIELLTVRSASSAPPANFPICKLTVQNNDSSLRPILQRYQIAFNTVCPELVKRFALKPDIAKNIVLTVGHLPAAAVTAGNQITIDAGFASQNPKQVVGALIHELTHAVQHYNGGAPFWFTEGMADYVRAIYRPADDDWSMPPVQPGDDYTKGYRISARFLIWVQQHTTPTIVDQLNHAIQTQTGQQPFSATFQRLTGSRARDLWNRYTANPKLAPFQRIPAPDTITSIGNQ